MSRDDDTVAEPSAIPAGDDMDWAEHCERQAILEEEREQEDDYGPCPECDLDECACPQPELPPDTPEEKEFIRQVYAHPVLGPVARETWRRFGAWLVRATTKP